MKKRAFLSPEELALLKEQEARSDKPAKRTPEQLEAIYTSGTNILVSASAGSGKTFVMVQRILDQILRGVGIEELFISTFTVKAATELKERLEKEIAQAMLTEKNEEVKQHLAQQLAALPNSDIGTMDAFVQKVLTKYGYLLEVSPNFRILQNASEEAVLQKEVFDQLFEDYYERKNRPLFERLVKNFTGNRKDLAGFREQVNKVYSFLQSTSNPNGWLDEVFLTSYDGADFETEEERLLTQIKDALFDLESFFQFHLANEGREFAKAKYLDMVEVVVEKIGILNQFSPTSAYYEVLSQVVEISRQSNGRALMNSSRKEDLKELAAAYNEERKAKIERLRALEEQVYHFGYQKAYHGEAKEILLLFRDFIRDFRKAYLERKRQEKAFDFADISHFAIQLLEEFPQVRNFYQNKYHEVMVDEYQDTNHLQERMLELLSKGDNRFMVGDIKQSIYRFRQADPQIFSQKFQDYGEDESKGKLILLKENFRSHVEVLNTTNEIFKRLMDEEVGEIAYNSQHYLVAGNPTKKEPTPSQRTECLFYDTENEEGLESIPELLMVIKEILRLHREEGVAFSDIALLTASRTRNKQILQAFEDYGIPLVADGGEESYLQSVEVMVMLDTLRTINNPLNDFALVALLKSAMFDFSEDDLARISLQTEKGLSKNLYEKLELVLAQKGLHQDLIKPSLFEKIKAFQDQLEDWRKFAQTHSLYDLVWKIYQDRYYYDYVGALPRGESRQANLYALSLRANDYEKTSFKGLSRFIQMIDKILAAQKDLANVALPAAPKAVQLMTIHKSKGLEFPYVFVINLDKDFVQQESKSSLILSRKSGIGIKYVADVELAQEDLTQKIRLSIDTLPYVKNAKELHVAMLSEQMRLLYVALTRAEKKLYLVGKGSRAKMEEEVLPHAEEGKLSLTLRQNLTSFQDWLWALISVFSREDLAFSYRFVTSEELGSKDLQPLEAPELFEVKPIHNRQNEDISRALAILENVERLNQLYKPAINLPTVRTPSQIKKFYEPVMETEGLDIMEKRRQTIQFSLPDLPAKKRVTGAEIGSATHELMQRIPLNQPMNLALLEESLAQVQAPEAVKQKIKLAKIEAFFQTNLGKLLLKEAAHVHREAPFAMLKTDPASGENFVVRGILDGYLLLSDRIVLFDYKTDKFQQPSELVARYKEQMALYAEALSRSYGFEKVEKYLVLLGGEDLQVVEVD